MRNRVLFQLHVGSHTDELWSLSSPPCSARRSHKVSFVFAVRSERVRFVTPFGGLIYVRVISLLIIILENMTFKTMLQRYLPIPPWASSM